MNKQIVSGTDEGQRQLNGPQSTGRDYRDLSEPQFTKVCDEDVAIVVRDGTRLLADIRRPEDPGKYPVLIAASPYLRQIKESLRGKVPMSADGYDKPDSKKRIPIKHLIKKFVDI